MINPNDISTVSVGQLPDGTFALTNKIAHEIGTELYRGTIQELCVFISNYIGTADGVGFRAVTVTDGQTLPTTTQQEFILVGKGTYYNVEGGATLILTEELNAIVSNGTYWFVGVEIPVNVELAGITQFIRSGFISTTPSESAVFDALALKADLTDVEDVANKTSAISGYSETLYPNEKASHDALDLKLNISDLPTNLTLYPTTTASDISGYVVMVKDIHDVRYNTTAVDVSTPTITTTDQLVSQRISDAGILIGQPGVFNITTFGNIRRLSGSGTATFYFKVFHRDSAGVETLICTSSISSPVTDGGYSEFTASGVWDDGDFVASDRIVIKSYAKRIAGGSDPVYQFQFGGTSPVRTLLPVPFSVVDAGYELSANKQNSLAIDGTGTKYPTVDAVNAGLPVNYSKIVYVNATSPITATIFDTENPPVTNDNLLKNDVANLYIGTDASTWVYNSTTYVTKTVTATSSNFYLAGTTTDAGNTKTGHITRSGAVTLTGSLNLAIAKISTTPNTSAGSYDILTRNSSTTALEKISSTALGNWTYSGGLIYPKSLTDRVVIGSNSESLGVAFTVKALSGSNNIAYFLDNTGNLIAKIDTGGVNSNILTASSYLYSPKLALNGYDSGVFGPSNVSQIKLLSGETWDIKGKLKYNVDYSSTYDVRTLVDKGYTDAKITQTITNGVTDKSPSEDAVFDAFQNYSKIILKNTTTSTPVTGTLSQTILYSELIPANSFKNGDFFNIILSRVGKVGTAGTLTQTVRINTTNTLTGATIIASNTGTTANLNHIIGRRFSLESVFLNGFAGGSAPSDMVNSSAAITTYAFDPTVDNYIFVVGQLSNTGDSMFHSSFLSANLFKPFKFQNHKALIIAFASCSNNSGLFKKSIFVSLDNFK